MAAMCTSHLLFGKMQTRYVLTATKYKGGNNAPPKLNHVLTNSPTASGMLIASFRLIRPKISSG